MLLFSFEGTLSEFNPVVIARRSHPFPSRTRKLSSLASTILGGQLPGKIERRRNEDTDEVNNSLRPCILYKETGKIREQRPERERQGNLFLL